MNPQGEVFRRLQEHLDRQALGFPSTKSGAEIRFLEQLFTPEEARLALTLSYKPAPTDQVVRSAAPELTREQTLAFLESMVSKGAIGWKVKEGVDHWFLLPMVIGMHEAQDGLIIPEIHVEADTYLSTRQWGVAFLSASLPQMRTIPVGIEIPVEHPIASYDQIRAIVESAPGPFAVLPCICREGEAWKGKPCRQTTRSETCLGFGNAAANILRRKHGREITRDEVISILKRNEEDGLVLQPSNTRNPSFVCSCCGCCCGMLGMQKGLPHPLDFWTSNFQAVVDVVACKACGKCAKRCQVNAVALAGSPLKAAIDPNRCVGCGLCVTTCPNHAIRLQKKSAETIPPADEEELYERMHGARKGKLETARMVARLVLGMKQ